MMVARDEQSSLFLAQHLRHGPLIRIRIECFGTTLEVHTFLAVSTFVALFVSYPFDDALYRSSSVIHNV